MRYITLLALAILLLRAVANGQEIPAYKADGLMKRLATGEDTVFIVNFWATWCGPCIKELPEFDKLANKYSGYPVKVLLVSLDFKNDYPAKIRRFVSKRKLPHEVVWLNETNANDFIPKITNEWQGSIPATMLYHKKNNWKKFYEGMVKSEQVAVLIDKQLAARY